MYIGSLKKLIVFGLYATYFTFSIVPFFSMSWLTPNYLVCAEYARDIVYQHSVLEAEHI